MKRYYVFDISEYYPAGGMDDCVLKTNDLEKARRRKRNKDGDYAYIYDVEKGMHVEEVHRESK